MKDRRPGRFIISSLDKNGRLKRSWAGELVERDGLRLTFVGVFDTTVEHPHLGTIEKGTISYEYFWLDRWYSVFGFYRPDRSFRNFYCNVNMPPALHGDALDLVDLDIDLIVAPDGSLTLLDEDEFEENAQILGYDDEVREKVQKAVEDLTAMIEARKFPFDILK